MKLGYELRIGSDYDYCEFGSDERRPCKLANIMHNGYDVVYEFRPDNKNTLGATIYPNKLQPRLKNV